MKRRAVDEKSVAKMKLVLHAIRDGQGETATVEGETAPFISLQDALDTLTLLTACLIEIDPAIATKRDMQLMAEDMTLGLRVNIESLRAFTRERGYHMLELLGGTATPDQRVARETMQ